MTSEWSVLQNESGSYTSYQIVKGLHPDAVFSGTGRKPRTTKAEGLPTKIIYQSYWYGLMIGR